MRMAEPQDGGKVEGARKRDRADVCMCEGEEERTRDDCVVQ